MGLYKTSFLRASIISHIPGEVSAQGLRFRVQGSGFPDEIGIVGSPQTRLALQGTSGPGASEQKKRPHDHPTRFSVMDNKKNKMLCLLCTPFLFSITFCRHF